MAWSRKRLPVVIAAGNHVRWRLRPLQDQARIGLMRSERDRLVEQRLVFDDAAAGLDPAARGEDRLRLGVVDAGRKLARGEAAEHHRMHGTDAGAGEHADHRFRHHRHVEDDAVALLHAEVAQQRGQHLHLGEQEVVGEDALGSGERRIVDDRGLRAAPAHHMAVDRVPAGVAHGIREPAAVDTSLRDRRPAWAAHTSRYRARRPPRTRPDRAASAHTRHGSGWCGHPWVRSLCSKMTRRDFVVSLQVQHCHSATSILQAAHVK